MVISAVVFPKKTLSSQKWLRRNDSKSVLSLLQPEAICRQYNKVSSTSIASNEEEASGESGDEQPRRVILSEAKTTNKPHRIYKTFCPDCYCKSFPVAPCTDERPRDSCCCRRTQRPRVKPPALPPPARYSVGKYFGRREHEQAMSKAHLTALKRRLAELEHDLQREEEEIERKKAEYRRLQQRCRRSSSASLEKCSSEERTDANRVCEDCQESVSTETANNRSAFFNTSSMDNLNLMPLITDDTQCNVLPEAQETVNCNMRQTRTRRKFHLPVPADSMALRFQKGMLVKTLRNFLQQ